MGLREDIEAEPTAKGRARVKSLAIRDAIRDGNKTFTRGRWALVVSAFDVVRDGEGSIVGVEVFVRAYRDGVEVRIDNRRRILNPPTTVHDGTFRDDVTPSGDVIRVKNYVQDVRGALLDTLIDSIQGHPNPDGWVKP